MRPSSHNGVTAISPAPVSTDSAPFGDGTSLRSRTNLAKQRMPLPHISLSEPSAFHILMRMSARSDRAATMRPSEPMPKWRSDTRRDSSDQSLCWARPSTNM